MGNQPLLTEIPQAPPTLGESGETLFQATFRPFEGRWVGAYGCHGLELIEIRVSPDRLEAVKLHGDPNVPTGEITFEVDSSGASRGRVAETGFLNPCWIPGKFEWDPLERDDCTFHFQYCGRVDLIRVANNFEYNEQNLRTFVAQNWTRLAEWNGCPVILPKAPRTARPAPVLSSFTYDSRGNIEAQLCAICQFHFEQASQVTQFECSHNFHFDCAQNWLKFKHQCPLCKRDVQ